MLIKNCTMPEIRTALESVNRQFGDNIALKNIQTAGKHYRMTLTVKSSRGPGARLSSPHHGKQRHLAAACWHVYGTFFDALPMAAVIVVGGPNGKTNVHPGDRWNDYLIGSQIESLYYSEACECGKE